MKNALANMQKEEFKEPEEDEDEDEEELKPILSGKFEVREEIEVCEKSDGDFCLSSSDCPDSRKEKKKFFTAHTILHYVNKDDPQGEIPEDPDDDPQYKKWEKAVQKWAEDEYGKKYEEPPKDKCEEDDFSKYFAEIQIISPADGSILSDKDLTIKAEISGEADVKQVDFFFDGKAIGIRKDKPYELNYTIPSDKNNEIIDIEVRVYDKDGGDDSDKVSVDISF
jgi:hypothetical protein